MSIYCIYRATNTVNGKSYIGFTQDLDKRKEQHLYSALSGSELAFHRAIRKYGQDSFIWEVIFQGKNRENILEWAEPHFILHYNTFGPLSQGYNMTCGGEAPPPNTIKTEEHKKNLSLALTGKPKSKSHCENLSKSKIGKRTGPRNREHMEAMWEARLGSKHSEETKKKMSESHKGKMSNKKWFHDPVTGKHTRCETGNQPIGWLPGRITLSEHQ